MKENFMISIESFHIGDTGDQANVSRTNIYGQLDLVILILIFIN